MMETENQTTNAGGSSKLSTIFIVVLALHIVIIMVIGAYHLVKGNQNPVVAEDETPAPQTENTVNGFENETTNETASAPVIEQGTMQVANQGIGLNEQPVQQPVQATTPAPQQAAPAPMAATPVLDQQPVGARPQPKLITEQVKPQPTQKAPTTTASNNNNAQVGSYKVVKGDTLSKIARNNGTTVKKIRELNNLKNDNLKIGQALKVPGASAMAETRQAAPTPAPAVVKAQPVTTAAVNNSGNYQTYEVVKGDTLMKIARSHNTTAKAIAELNNVQNPAKIKIGTKLKIPSAELQASSPSAQTQNNAQAASEVQQINMRPMGGADMAMLRQPEEL